MKPPWLTVCVVAAIGCLWTRAAQPDEPRRAATPVDEPSAAAPLRPTPAPRGERGEKRPRNEKSAVPGARQEGVDNERAQRDAAGLLTIEGTIVDESDRPVSKARIRLLSSPEGVTTALSDSQGRFRFRSLDLPTARHLSFVADNLKDRTKGYLSIHEEGTLGLPAPIKIVLKPPRELVVVVIDKAGAPVVGALVEVEAGLRPIDEGRTDADGTLRFRIAAEADIDLLFALKSGAGFDYWTNRAQRGGEPRPVPAKVALTLDGTRTVRVHAIDSSGKPVPGVGVVPWTILKTGQTNDANLSGFRSQLERAETDSAGIATIDWLPVNHVRNVTFLSRSGDFHLPAPPALEPDPQGGVADLEMRLLRVTKISGTVQAADGKPAAGIVLQAEGRGDSNHYFRGLARTNAEGAFEFRAYPEQSYLISVLDENWAARACVVANLREDEPISGLELRLGRGTVLRGVATTPEGRIEPNTTVTLVQTAPLPAPAKSPELVRWARTDGEGRYHIRIGPGTYDVFSPGHNERITLAIDSQSEVVHDFRAGK